MRNNSFTDDSSFCNTVTGPHNSLENRTVLESPQIWLLAPKRTERLRLGKEWTKRKIKSGKKALILISTILIRRKSGWRCSTVLLKSSFPLKKNKQKSWECWFKWAIIYMADGQKDPTTKWFYFSSLLNYFHITWYYYQRKRCHSANKQTKPTNLYTVSLGPGVKDGLRMIRVEHQTQRETGLACGGRGFIYRPLCSMKNK